MSVLIGIGDDCTLGGSLNQINRRQCGCRGCWKQPRHPDHQRGLSASMAEITVHYDGPIVTRTEARTAKSKHFFLGCPCPHGHIALRRLCDGKCTKCTNQYLDGWRKRNPDYRKRPTPPISIHYDGPVISRADAKSIGAGFYFTGEPCRHGHIAQRYTSNQYCLTCKVIREKTAKYKDSRRVANLSPEKLAARQQSEGRPERAASRRRRAGTQEYKAVRRRYRQSAKAQAAARAYEQRPDRRKASNAATLRYFKTERGIIAARINAQTRRARQASAKGEFTRADHERLRETQKICHICHKKFTKADPATLDHVIALADGGLHDRSNIALAHRSCNSRKNMCRTHLI
jgi:hypothetical protein